MGAIGLSIDPVTFEILSHRVYQITMEMGVTLERVGGTVNTTQMKDYLTALYLPNGDVLCAITSTRHLSLRATISASTEFAR